MSGAAKAAGALGLAIGAREVAQFAGDALQLAVTAEEIDSKFEAVYGSAEDFRESISAWADQAGVTDSRAKDLVATFGNLAMAQGISKGETEEFAQKVATLAGDMGSFNDADPEQVFEDLNKALLTTEREGLKKYGIAVSENEVKQRALELAIADGRGEVTQADRALASYEIVMRQAGKAVGDLERTSESFANRQRQQKANLEELQEEIGKKLLPVYEDFLGLSEDLLPVLESGVDDLGDLTQAYSELAGMVAIATGSSGAGGGLQGFMESAGRVVDTLNDRLNPIMWATNLAFGDLTDNAGITSGALDETGGVTQTMYEHMQRMNRSARDAANHALPALTTELGDTEAAMFSVDEMLRIFTGNMFGLAAATKEAREEEERLRRLWEGGSGSGQENYPEPPPSTPDPRLNQPGFQSVLSASSMPMPEATVVNINIGVAGDPYQTAQTIADLLTQYEQSSGTRLTGISLP
jgi:hypothetical protein